MMKSLLVFWVSAGAILSATAGTAHSSEDMFRLRPLQGQGKYLIELEGRIAYQAFASLLNVTGTVTSKGVIVGERTGLHVTCTLHGHVRAICRSLLGPDGFTPVSERDAQELQASLSKDYEKGALELDDFDVFKQMSLRIRDDVAASLWKLRLSKSIRCEREESENDDPNENGGKPYMHYDCEMSIDSQGRFK